MNIVDRGVHKVTKSNDPYYSFLKDARYFKTVKYANLKETSLSKGGRQLVANGKVSTQNEMPIIFVAVLMK